MIHGFRALRALSAVGMRPLVLLSHIAFHLGDDSPDRPGLRLMYQNLAQKLSGHRDTVSGKKCPGQTRRPVFLHIS